MLLDTAALVELLSRPRTDALVRQILDHVGDEILFASPIQLGELADAARQKRLTVDDVVRKARGILELVPLDADIAVQASALKAEARSRAHSRDFSLIDGVILATARTIGQRLLTRDKEFRGFSDAVILEPA